MRQHKFFWNNGSKKIHKVYFIQQSKNLQAFTFGFFFLKQTQIFQKEK